MENTNIEELKKMEKEWQETNPLYKWRKKNRVSNEQVALFVGVSNQSVIMWQRGAWLPSANNLERMSRLMNEQFLMGKWKDWYKRKPQI